MTDTAAAMRPQEARDLAARLAGQGLAVFPVGLRWNHEKGSIDKRPITQHGFQSATTDLEELAELFRKASLKSGEQWGVGIWPGASGHLVVDVDVKGGARGLESLAELESEHGPLPGRRVTTGSGGLHIWLRKPVGVEIGNAKPAPGIDIRADGGLIVAPGTFSPWGSWTPDGGTITDCPTWLLERLTAGSQQQRKDPIDERLRPGDRHHALVRLAGAMRAVGANAGEIFAALQTMNRQRCDPPKTDRELRIIAEDIAGRYEPNPTVTFTRDEPADAHPGGAWILDQPTRIAALWGTGDEVAWSQGETLIVVGSDGTGKTVLAQNLITRMIGLDTTSLLGLPVQQRRRVLYLAQDRPRQSARAFQRLVGTADRALLDEKLRVIDTPIGMVDTDPELLIRLAQENEADTLIVDSVKDVVVEPSSEKSGLALKQAYALCIAEEVETGLLHHDRKPLQDGRTRRLLKLADVYGSRFIVAGSGSVIALNGTSGDPVIELRQLKQPSAEVGPLRVLFDFETGTVDLYEGGDLLSILTAAGKDGITAQDAARQLYETDKPSNAEKERARRKLKTLTAAGLATELPALHKEPARFVLTILHTVLLIRPHSP